MLLLPLTLVKRRFRNAGIIVSEFSKGKADLLPLNTPVSGKARGFFRSGKRCDNRDGSSGGKVLLSSLNPAEIRAFRESGRQVPPSTRQEKGPTGVFLACDCP